jgi:hypothetical protein
MLDPRAGSSAVDGYPHFVRCLCSDLVKSKRGQQANDSLGDCFTSLSQSMVNCYIGVRQGVETPAFAHELAFSAELPEVFVVYRLGTHLSGAHNPRMTSQFQYPF